MDRIELGRNEHVIKSLLSFIYTGKGEQPFPSEKRKKKRNLFPWKKGINVFLDCMVIRVTCNKVSLVVYLH